MGIGISYEEVGRLLQGMTYRVVRDGRIPWIEPDYIVEIEMSFGGRDIRFERVIWGDIPDRFEVLDECVRDGMLGRKSFADFCTYVNTGEGKLELKRMYEFCVEMNEKMEYLYGEGYVSEWYGAEDADEDLKGIWLA